MKQKLLGIAFIFLSCANPRSSEKNLSIDKIVGQWKISDFSNEGVSAYSNEQAKQFVNKTIVITEKSFIAPMSDSCNYDRCKVERIKVDDEMMNYLKDNIDSITQYSFSCQKNYEEFVYLLNDKQIVYQVDGVIFRCSRL
jgi:hypothetical protein